MFWARGGGATRRETIPAAAPRRTSPELTNSGAPGVISTKVWVRGARHGTLHPPEHSYGLGGALRRGLHGRRRICVPRVAGVHVRACFWAREWWPKVVCSWAGHRQGGTRLGRGRAALQGCCHGGAAALPTNNEESSHAQREKKGKKGHGMVITPS